jgi:hypothetical protein
MIPYTSLAALLLAVPLGADAAELKLVQSGTASIAGGFTDASANVIPVDPTRAFLVFSARVSHDAPDAAQVTGQLIGDQTVEFRRFAQASSAVEIRWHLVEYASGATVRRGSQLIDGAALTQVPIGATVDLSRSFPLVTVRTGGNNFDDDDFVRARFASGSTLDLEATVQPVAGGVAEWQVVELDGVAVHSGGAALVGTATSTNVPVQAGTDLSKSWLLYSYKVEAGSADTCREHMVSGVLAPPGEVRFERGGPAAGNIDLSWFLVEFQDATTVQSGSVTIPAAGTSAPAGLTAVDPARTFVVGGAQGRGGRSLYAADDNPGPGWATLELAPSNDQVIATRAVADSTVADFGWFAVTAGPSQPGTGPGGGGSPGSEGPGKRGPLDSLEGWSCGIPAGAGWLPFMLLGLLRLARRR